MRNRFFELAVGAMALAAATGCATSPKARFSNPVAYGSATDAGDAPTPAPPAPTPPTPAAPGTASPATPPRALSPCAPPPCAPPPICETPCQQRALWHVRGLVGYSTWFGKDAGDDCAYVGADVGRTFCNSCWSLDGFWRGHTAHFPRDPDGEDGGTWNHVGLKVTNERSLDGNRWFAYGGVGPEYFWTSGYQHDDSGFGVFGEVGIGFIVNRNWRVRAGVDVHGMNTDAGRKSAADDGDSRWLWVVAPVVGIEFDF